MWIFEKNLMKEKKTKRRLYNKIFLTYQRAFKEFLYLLKQFNITKSFIYVLVIFNCSVLRESRSLRLCQQHDKIIVIQTTRFISVCSRKKNLMIYGLGNALCEEKVMYVDKIQCALAFSLPFSRDATMHSIRISEIAASDYMTTTTSGLVNYA